MKAARFLISGGANTLLSYGSFLVTFKLSESAALSLVAGLLTGVTSSYFLNKHWIWKEFQRNSLIKFLLVQACLLGMNWVILHLISLTNFPREVAQIFIYGAFAILSFQVYGRFVFAPPR